MRSERIQIRRFSGSPRNPRTHETVVRDNCPFRTAEELPGKLPGACSVDPTVDCRYGLTEINVPPKCPLRDGTVSTLVALAPKEYGKKKRQGL